MNKVILICTFFPVLYGTKVIAQEGWYVSPGVQIGIDSKGNSHRAAQITIGILIEDYPFATGLTIGSKWIWKPDKIRERIMDRYNYYDLQCHPLESIILETPIQPGIGFGLMNGDNISLAPRFKIWSGLIFFYPPTNLLI